MDLLVRAANGEETCEFVPPRLLYREFPDFFVHKFVHWYNSRHGVVEFRPIEDPWNSLSSAKWTLVRSEDESSKWQLEKDGSSLLSLRSKTAKTLTDVLSLSQIHRRSIPFLHHLWSRSKSIFPTSSLDSSWMGEHPCCSRESCVGCPSMWISH